MVTLGDAGVGVGETGGDGIDRKETAITGVSLVLYRPSGVRRVHREERGTSSGCNQGVQGEVKVPIVLSWDVITCTTCL